MILTNKPPGPSNPRSPGPCRVIKGDHPLPGQLLSFVASRRPTPQKRWREVKAVPRLDADG